MVKFLTKNRHVLLYGISLAALLFLLKWLELHLLVISHAFEIYIGFIAIIFTCVGIWLALRLMKPKTETIVVEKEVYVNDNSAFKANEKDLLATGLSKRELEVLQLMAQGLSNREIAAHLFVSLNTIKTHSSNLFSKMDVKRRIHAIEKAKRSGLIPK